MLVPTTPMTTYCRRVLPASVFSPTTRTNGSTPLCRICFEVGHKVREGIHQKRTSRKQFYIPGFRPVCPQLAWLRSPRYRQKLSPRMERKPGLPRSMTSPPHFSPFLPRCLTRQMLQQSPSQVRNISLNSTFRAPISVSIPLSSEKHVTHVFNCAFWDLKRRRPNNSMVLETG